MTRADVVRAAAAHVLRALQDPPYRHTSHLLVRLDGEVIVEQHRRGPRVADVFSITKSVLATVLGVAAGRGQLPPLHEPVAAVLPELRGTPAQSHTWRHLLTMTRGARVDGPWDVDAVTALPGGQVAHVAAAPQLRPPGTAFGYDNAGSHLLAAAAGRVLGEPVSAYAERELFRPLGIADAAWAADPDGVPFGYGHLRLSAADLGLLGQLWSDGGYWAGRQLIDPGFLAEMTRAHSPGGPPEEVPYGFLLWVDGDVLMAGGWGGQHVLVVPSARAVVVTTGETGFDPGPPPRDDLPPDWQPALVLVRRHLLPVLRGLARG